MTRIKFVYLFIGAMVLLSNAFALGSESKTPTAAKSNANIETQSNGPTLAPALKSPLSGEQIKWQVVAAGGTRGSSTNFILTGTAGQTAVGNGTSTNFAIGRGYWQNFVVDTSYACGDCNGDGSIDISDYVYLDEYIWSGGPAPLGRGDVNCDNVIDVSDEVYLIAYIFSGGAAPCAGCK
jgi:hypothetical protein